MVCERCGEAFQADPRVGLVLAAKGDWQRWCNRCMDKSTVCFSCGDIVARRYLKEHVEISHGKRALRRLAQLHER